MRIPIIGDEGYGKTLWLTAIGLLAHEIYGVPIAANYPLKGVAGAQFIDTYEKLQAFRDGVLLIDEIWELMDSRLPRDNIKFSHWVRQTRKKSLLMFYTTQTLDQIDKRLKLGSGTSLGVLLKKGRYGFRALFFSMNTGEVRRKFEIHNPELFYEYYDTNYVVQPFRDLSAV